MCLRKHRTCRSLKLQESSPRSNETVLVGNKQSQAWAHALPSTSTGVLRLKRPVISFRGVATLVTRSFISNVERSTRACSTRLRRRLRWFRFPCPRELRTTFSSSRAWDSGFEPRITRIRKLLIRALRRVCWFLKHGVGNGDVKLL